MAQEPLKRQQSERTYEDELNEILDELGISYSEDFILILHNDNVNDMEDVVVALYEVCRLPNERCVSVMMEAHNNGKSVITTGEINTLLDLKLELNKRGITTSIETSQ
jgi:ATP-dependent Clp protease adapter protein ClpS